MRKHLPNAVTILGFVACAVLLWQICMRPDWLWLTFILFAVAVYTDRKDGQLARRYGKTRIGAQLDRWRDKSLIWVMCFFFMVIRSDVPLAIKILVGAIALGEVCLAVMLILESWYDQDPSAGWWGKKKMGAECISIGAYLLGLLATESIGEGRLLVDCVATLLFFATLPFVALSLIGHIAQFRGGYKSARLRGLREHAIRMRSLYKG